MRVERIGDARLILGDCREVLPTLGRVDAVVTDPPYGMAFQSNYRKVKHDEIAGDDAGDLLAFACAIPARHSAYVFCRWDNLGEVPKPRSVVTWVKNNWSMGDLNHEHARQTEVALFYPGPDHDFPAGRPTDVVQAARTGNEHHPSEKPVALMRRIVTWTRGTVVDPFMGSGSTGIAALQEGRRFIGIEVDPAHFATACRRIEAVAKQGTLFGARPKPEQYEVRYLPFGEDATADESVQPLGGHHGRHARLAVKR